MRLALLAVAVLAAYAASLPAAFQFDDYNVIVRNPAVQSWGALAEELGRGLRPALKVSYALNWTLGDGQPWGFHAFNVLVHAVNASQNPRARRNACSCRNSFSMPPMIARRHKISAGFVAPASLARSWSRRRWIALKWSYIIGSLRVLR